jgi:hypothetical protein
MQIKATRQNFNTAVDLFMGESFRDLIPNPVQQLNMTINEIFIEQPEFKNLSADTLDVELEPHIDLIRRVARQLKFDGQFNWDEG